MDEKQCELDSRNGLVVGCRQVEKELALGTLRCVYVARDVDTKLKRDMLKKINSACVDVLYVKTKEELGQRAGIDVKAAVVGVKKSLK